MDYICLKFCASLVWVGILENQIVISRRKLNISTWNPSGSDIRFDNDSLLYFSRRKADTQLISIWLYCVTTDGLFFFLNIWACMIPIVNYFEYVLQIKDYNCIFIDRNQMHLEIVQVSKTNPIYEYILVSKSEHVSFHRNECHSCHLQLMFI